MESSYRLVTHANSPPEYRQVARNCVQRLDNAKQIGKMDRQQAGKEASAIGLWLLVIHGQQRVRDGAGGLSMPI